MSDGSVLFSDQLETRPYHRDPSSTKEFSSHYAHHQLQDITTPLLFPEDCLRLSFLWIRAASRPRMQNQHRSTERMPHEIRVLSWACRKVRSAQESSTSSQWPSDTRSYQRVTFSQHVAIAPSSREYTSPVIVQRRRKIKKPEHFLVFEEHRSRTIPVFGPAVAGSSRAGLDQCFCTIVGRV